MFFLGDFLAIFVGLTLIGLSLGLFFLFLS